MDDFVVGVQAAAGVFVLAGFLALVNERINEFVFKPLLQQALSGEMVSKLMPYVGFVTGAVISVGFGLDLFAPLAVAFGLAANVIVTMGLTAVLVAGGSQLLHDVWPQTP